VLNKSAVNQIEIHWKDSTIAKMLDDSGVEKEMSKRYTMSPSLALHSKPSS